MYFILEALFVGLYSAFIFNILFFIIKNKYILLFTLGFVKHFLSYYLGIQTFFCNHGYQCKKVLANNTGVKNIRYVATDDNLFIESLLEGLWFLVAGAAVFMVIGKAKPYIVMFVIGTLTHLIVEKMEIHKYFCRHNCIHL